MSAIASLRPDHVPTVQAVIDRVLTDESRSRATRRKYESTLKHLRASVGNEPVTVVTHDRLAQLLEEVVAPGSAASTYNRHRAALAAVTREAHDRGWLSTDPSRLIKGRKVVTTKAAIQRQQAIGKPELQRLWRHESGHGLRDRTLWRVLYDTAARINEVLALDVPNVDLDQRHATITMKGGDARRAMWSVGANRLLRAYIGERSSGPLFVTSRKVVAGSKPIQDVAPDGHGRLSYGAAYDAFTKAMPDWTIHHLRHSRLSHLGDEGWTAEQLRAISGHRSLRQLQHYVHLDGARLRAALDDADGTD